MTLLELTAFWLAGFWLPLGIAAYHIATTPETDSARASLGGTARAENINPRQETEAT